MIASPRSTASHQPPRRGPVARALLGLWMGVYLFAVSAAPIADTLAGHGRAVVAHWEDSSDERCPPKHEEVGCQFVQAAFGAGVVSPVAGPRAVERATVALPPSVAVRLGWASAQRVTLPTRGPPSRG
jgi:hypothetical protein